MDIPKEYIKLMQSQRLDDTPQGGGQMTSNEVVDGGINNLYPDISRLDRVYGRVSLRKCYLAVQTSARQTYYGSHTILTQQAKDPNVSICFFSSENWFDTREDAQNRIESFLVKGPLANISLWSTHYVGTKTLALFTAKEWPAPEIGDVLVFHRKVDGVEQYMRVISVSTEIRLFNLTDTVSTEKKIITLEINTQLNYDFVGEDINSTNYNASYDDTLVYTTVAADASRYYGVSTLVNSASVGELQVQVESIFTPLVPSAASQTPVLDAEVGVNSAPLASIENAQDNSHIVTRPLSYNIVEGGQLHIGHGVKRNSFEFTGNVALHDDGNGNIIWNSTNGIVGSIDYATGIINFGMNTGITTGSGTGTISYVPAAPIVQVSETGAIQIDINNRSSTYVFKCDPIPEPGTLRIDYLAGGSWYTLYDKGNGKITGIGNNPAIGSGTLIFDSGSVSVTLGNLPDIGSSIIYYWAKPSEFYDLVNSTDIPRYPSDIVIPPVEELKVITGFWKIYCRDEAINRNTLIVSWEGDSGGPGLGGQYGIMDDGFGNLREAYYESNAWHCEDRPIVGNFSYPYGQGHFRVENNYPPTANEVFKVDYFHGEKIVDTFIGSSRDVDGHVKINLSAFPITPYTFDISWNTNPIDFDSDAEMQTLIDPKYVFKDDGTEPIAGFVGEVDDGMEGWFPSQVNLTNGEVYFHPDRYATVPIAHYKWIEDNISTGEEITFKRVFERLTYEEIPTIWDGDTIQCSYCSYQSLNEIQYWDESMNPIFTVDSRQDLELIPGSLGVEDGNGTFIYDGGNGKLYTKSDGTVSTATEVGVVDYVKKTFKITSNSINISRIVLISAVGTGHIDPATTMVFRAPGAPLIPGSVTISGTSSSGNTYSGTANFSGIIEDQGIYAYVNYNTGLCHVAFGEWVTDDVTAQAESWYNSTANDGLGNVWKPFAVRASTVKMNCVIQSYLPLDKDLLGIDPVRLPMDGKVPIFRDGYIAVIHHPREELMPNPLDGVDTTGTLVSDQTEYCGRTNVDLLEVYKLPTDKQLADGIQTCAMLIPEVEKIDDQDNIRWTYNLSTGEVTFKTGFVLPQDSDGTYNQLIILSRIEDMVLISDAQVTGHLAFTQPLTHDYPSGETLVSSVLPSQVSASADLQSRAYNEFEQGAWTGVWSDQLIGSAPLNSYNFIDYPISVNNRCSVTERWLILFQTGSTVDVIGENIGTLADNVKVIFTEEEKNAFNTYWDGTSSGVYKLADGEIYLIILNRNFLGDLENKNYYWIMNINGFGVANWPAGACIRFNTDAANFPLWFVRTTLQGPATEPTDRYTIQVRGDSS